MILLNNSQSLQASSGASAIQCVVNADVVTAASTGIKTDSFQPIYSSTLPTTQTPLFTCSSNQQALIKSIQMHNTTGSIVSSVAFYIGSAQLISLTIPANGSASYESGDGWSVYDASGQKIMSLTLPIVPLPVNQGGTGDITLTAHAVLLGEGTSPIAFATVGTSGRLFQDQGASADPAFVAPSTIALSAFGAATANISMGGFRITSGAAAIAGTDLPTLTQVQNLIATGTHTYLEVQTLSTTNINIASPGATIGGYSPSNGDIIQLTGQSTTSQNGPWTFNGSASALTRPTEYASGSTVRSGYIVIVGNGTYAGYISILSTDNATVDTTNTSWSNGPALGYTATAPVSITGNVISLNIGSGLTTSGGNLIVDTTVVPELATPNSYTRRNTGVPVIGTITGAVTLNLGALSSSSGITWTTSPLPTDANNFELTQTGNVTSITISNGTGGTVYNIVWVGAGFTWPTSMTGADFGSAGLGTMTITSGKENLQSGYWRASTSHLRSAMNTG